MMCNCNGGGSDLVDAGTAADGAPSAAPQLVVITTPPDMRAAYEAERARHHFWVTLALILVAWWVVSGV